MKHIIVLRHAKSNWSASYGGADVNRPITEKANQRATKTGKMMAEKGIAIDFALVSVALRTQQTFRAFCQGYGKTIVSDIKNEIYRGDLKTILGLVQNLDGSHNTVMLVGHEPTCSFFTEQLLKSLNQEINYRTSTIAKIDFEIKSWTDADWMIGSLDFIERAKL